MIQKEYDKYALICDICGEIVKKFDSFALAVDNKQNVGVTPMIEDGKWIDVCKECRQ